MVTVLWFRVRITCKSAVNVLTNTIFKEMHLTKTDFFRLNVDFENDQENIQKKLCVFDDNGVRIVCVKL